ncbi:alpha/beta hydrolase [Geodermatophilus sp. TF02-6]|uniref:alpha/beta hydrolase n=1 Tax=Geodermatophilus sp. TF02-6 TaxID=2250575 RepID=UPI000DEB8688|nr:alpha/beta hydrolase [Geodermatophilus sp. TF02-6]RBY77206.1 alpha/beta hydrolase [Geodermatophilus sp. TF02-6]
MTAETTEWAGPARFLPPHEPSRRDDGALHYSGLTYAVAFGYRPLQLDLWVPAGEGPAQLQDAKAAVRYLRANARELGISTERVGAMGESAGGHIVAVLGLSAHRPDLEGTHGVVGPSSAVDVVVDWYGPADLSTMPRTAPPPEVAAKLPPELLVPPEDQLTRGLEGQALADASPVTHVTPDAPPFLLVHGTADRLVPYAQSEQLHAALTAAGASARLVPVEGAGHVFDGHDDVDGLVRLSAEYLAEALR